MALIKRKLTCRSDYSFYKYLLCLLKTVQCASIHYCKSARVILSISQGCQRCPCFLLSNDYNMSNTFNNRLTSVDKKQVNKYIIRCFLTTSVRVNILSATALYTRLFYLYILLSWHYWAAEVYQSSSNRAIDWNSSFS